MTRTPWDRDRDARRAFAYERPAELHSRLARDAYVIEDRGAVIGTLGRTNTTVPGVGSGASPLIPLCRWEGKPYDWRSYAVTLFPVGRADNRVPYDVSPPTTASPTGTLVNNVVQPAQALVRLSWGVGGARTFALADYPVFGAVVGLAGDYVEVQAQLDNVGVIASVDEMPVFGAILAPGRPTTPWQLTLTEAPQLINVGNTFTWKIPPYAKAVRVTSNGTGLGLTPIDLLAPGGTVIERWYRSTSSSPAVYSIAQPMLLPQQAESMRLTNSQAANDTYFVTWVIGTD